MFFQPAPPPAMPPVAATPAPVVDAAVRLRAPASTLAGEDAHVRISGLAPGEVVRLHALRKMPRWAAQADGTWAQEVATLHAWADLAADAAGEIDVDRARPLRGSWRQADGAGFLWSGYVRGAPELQGVGPEALYALRVAQQGTVFLRLERAGRIVAATELRVLGEAPNVRFSTVQVGDVAGVFAAPAGLRRGPALIVLHGSEGGDLGRERQAAARFAAQGFATLALSYWAPARAPIPGVRDRNFQTPIELIGRARDWLARQPEADVDRLGLVGWSKGAEYAEVAAVRYP